MRRFLTRPGLWAVPAYLLPALWLLAAFPAPWWHLALGWLLETALEYVVHRWAFHWSGWQPSTYRWLHGAHHEQPGDTSRLAVPLTTTLPVALAVALLAPWGVTAGALAGLAWYEVAHHLTHLKACPRPLRGLRRHHLRHHLHGDAAFGVSTRLWDYLLGTMPPAPHPFVAHEDGMGDAL